MAEEPAPIESCGQHEDQRAEHAILSAAEAYRLVDEARGQRERAEAALVANGELAQIWAADQERIVALQADVARVTEQAAEAERHRVMAVRAQRTAEAARDAALGRLASAIDEAGAARLQAATLRRAIEAALIELRAMLPPQGLVDADRRQEAIEELERALRDEPS